MSDDEIIPLAAGASAPDFTLANVLSDGTVSLHELHGEIVVINFWSGECPWSRFYDGYFAARAREWAAQGIRLLHISSNATEPVADVAKAARALGISTPVLHDPGNEVADAFGALTTPHVFVITPEGRIAYQGAVDNRTFRQREPTINYLDAALQAVLSGQSPDPAETPAYGCTIVRAIHGSL